MTVRTATLRDPGPLEFDAPLLRSDDSGAACFVDFPWDLKDTFGKGNLVPVHVVWDGRVAYRGSLARMGGACAMLLCRKDVVAALGKAAGDRVHVRVTLDAEPREVVLPTDAAAAVEASAPAAAGWAALSPSSRRDYADWIADAKRPETRAKRIAQAVALIAERKRLKG
jgi:hypothetical protein